MSLITSGFIAAAHGGNPAVVAPALAKAADKYGIVKAVAIECWLANVANESGGFINYDEDMDYTSAQNIYNVFRSHFSSLADAATCVRNPEKLGNRVYAALGGYAYRGAGWPQLTGISNHRVFGLAVGITDVTKVRAYLETPEGSAECAAWFYSTHGCAAYAEAGDLTSVRDVWEGIKPHNANVQGMQSTLTWYHQFQAAMVGAPITPALAASKAAVSVKIVTKVYPPQPTADDLNEDQIALFS